MLAEQTPQERLQSSLFVCRATNTPTITGAKSSNFKTEMLGGFWLSEPGRPGQFRSHRPHNVSVKSSGSTSIATGETIPRRAKSRRGMFRDSFVAKQADKRLEILSSCRKFCSAQGDFQPREFCRITVRELWLLAGGMGNTDWDAKGFVDDLRDSGFTLFAAPA